MEVSNFYTVETLQHLNDSHDYGYPVDQSDTDKVNRLIGLIQQERDAQEIPMPGDLIAYTTRNGDYYRDAHVERIQDGSSSICLSSCTPFCFDDKGKAGYDADGRFWVISDAENWETDGFRMKLFKTWGRHGRCQNGTVYFKTLVRAWKYTAPVPFFGKYTTKDWTKYFISRLPDPERKNEFTYKSDDFTVYSKTEFDRLVKILHGEVFDTICRNSLVLWGYQMEWESLTKKEWNEKQADVHLSFLGISSVKIRTCHDTHTVTIYKKK